MSNLYFKNQEIHSNYHKVSYFDNTITILLSAKTLFQIIMDALTVILFASTLQRVSVGKLFQGRQATPRMGLGNKTVLCLGLLLYLHNKITTTFK